MKQILLIVFLFLHTKLAFSQSPEDMMQELGNAKQDTTRVRLLLELSDAAEDSTLMLYGGRALDLINKNLLSSTGELKKKYLGYKASALNNLGYGYRTFDGDNQKAIDYCIKALALYDETGEKNGLTDCLSNIQHAYIVTGDFVRAKFYINKALKIQIAAKDSSALSETYASLAEFFDLQGKLDSALYYEQLSLQLCKQMDDKKGIAYALDNLGTLYQKKGDMQMAIKYYFQGLYYCDKYLNKLEGNLSLIHLGNIYTEMNEYSKSLVYYKRSLNLAQSTNLKDQLPILLSNLGFTYRRLHKTDSSFFYYNKALKVAKEINSKTTLSLILVEMGEAYLEIHDTIIAINFYRNALEESEVINANDRISDVCNRIGIIFLSQGKIDSAYYYGSRSLKLSEDTRIARYIMNANYLMSRVNKIKGNYKEALNQYSRYILTRDSLNNNNVYRTALSNEFKYEKEKNELIAKTEQQKRQIQIENQRKIIWISSIAFLIIIGLGIFLFQINQKKKEDFFQRNIAELQMKALRAQMNPHFIFNCMNSIQNFMLKKNMEEAVKYQQKFAKLIRMMLDHSDVKTVSLKEELDLLELYMQLENLRLTHGFDYELKIDENIDQEETEIPSMLLQPHIENAIWHGLSPMKEKGKLQISISKNETVLHCTVQDNGIGLEASAKVKQEQNKNHQSKGTSITAKRIALLNRNLKKENTIRIFDLSGTGSSGTRIEIDIPLS